MQKENEKASWADAVVDELIKRKRKEYVCEGMWTPSGYFHIGNARPEIFTPYSVYRTLTERGYKAKQNFIIDDFDAVRKIPLDLGLSEEEKKEYLGHPCALAPSPIPGYKTWADAFVSELKEKIKDFGVPLTVLSAYRTYKSGKLNKLVGYSLDHAKEIVSVWNRIAGTEKPETFLPIQVFCDNCGRIFFTEATSWDGKQVTYKCTNCNHKGKKSPFNANAKLHWRVHWVCFWILNKVDFESAGKDHFSKGGSVDVGQAMTKEVYKESPPYQIPTEFIQIAGTKMAGSVGRVINLTNWLEVASPELFRYLNFSYKPNKVIEFDFRGNSFLLLNDRFERAERIYYETEKAENKKVEVQLKRAYELSKISKPAEVFPGQLTFNNATQLVQLLDIANTTHLLNVLEQTCQFKPTPTKKQLTEIKQKFLLAKNWLEKYAPERFKVKFVEVLDPKTKESYSSETKRAFKEIAQAMDKAKTATEIQQAIFQTAKSRNIPVSKLFKSLYLGVLGKESGPKIGTLAVSLGKDKITARIHELAGK